MLVNLLAAKAADAAGNYKGMSNEFWGVFTFVLGVLVVFAGMLVLVLCVSLVAKAMEGGKKKDAAKESSEDDEPEEVLPVEAAAETEEVTDEKTRVAVIAAVLAYLSANGGAQNEFVVKKIKKLKNR